MTEDTKKPGVISRFHERNRMRRDARLPFEFYIGYYVDRIILGRSEADSGRDAGMWGAELVMLIIAGPPMLIYRILHRIHSRLWYGE